MVVGCWRREGGCVWWVVVGLGRECGGVGWVLVGCGCVWYVEPVCLSMWVWLLCAGDFVYVSRIGVRM